MELYKSLTKKTKSYDEPFKHFELNEPLTGEAIKEICLTDIPDPKKENLNITEHMTLMQHRYLALQAANEFHVVLNHQHGVISCQRFE